jgi:translocation and assembly module TamB
MGKRKMMRKIFLIFFSTAGIALLVAMSMAWNFEKLDSLIQQEVKTLSKRGIPVQVTVGKSFVRILPLELNISNIHVEPLGEIGQQVMPLDIGALTIRPSIWHLIVGKVHIANLIVKDADVQLKIKEQSSTQEPNYDVFSMLSKVPVSRLELQNISVVLKTKVESQWIEAKLKTIQSTLIYDPDFINLSLKIHEVTGSLDGIDVIQKGFFETRFILTRKNIVLTDFKLKESNSFLVAAGTSQIDLKKKIFGNGNINIRSETSSEKVRFIYKIITKKENTPLDKIQTMFRGDVRLSLSPQIENVQAQIEAALFNFQVEKFRVGNLMAKATYDGKEKKIQIQEARVSNNGVTAFTKSTTLNLETLTLAPVDVSVKMFHLKDYIQYSLNNKLTSEVHAEGNVNCGGGLDPLKITCKGNLSANNIQVNSGSNQHIVSIPSAKATGTATVTAQEVSYEAEVQSQSTTGTSSGKINYENGFDINYSTQNLNITEIKHLSKLEMTGIAKVRGNTKGNSKTATFDFIAEAKDFELNKFKLGSISTQLNYKSGVLYFTKIQGALVSSRYLGDLTIDLSDETMSGKLQFPFIDLSVAQDAIKEHLQIPVPLSGSGSAIVSLNSPLDIKSLALQAKARLYNCKVADQHIDNVDLDIISENGKLQFRSGLIEEKSTSVRLNGSINIRTEEFDLAFSSKRAQTEDIIYTANYLKKIKGVLKIDGTITKSFKDPQILMNFYSDEFFYAKQSLSPLSGRLQFSKKNLLFNAKASDRFSFSFNDQSTAPTYHIEGFTNNFDLSPLIATVLDSDSVDSFKFNTSSKFNLKIPKNNFENASGYAQISILDISSNTNTIGIDTPVSFFLTNGKLNFSTFTLKGKGGQLAFSSVANSKIPVDISLSGIFSLSLLHIFAPFLETLEGQTTINLKLKYGRGTTQMIGSAYIEDGYIKLPEIQHALESMKADILFNQDRIVLNAINGKFASGQLVGDGSIAFKGHRNIPLLLNLYLDNVNLNIPPQVNTQGNANLKLTGNWLPFTLSGEYQIFDGEITKELSGSTEATLDSPYQIFLPQDLRRKAISPIALDLNLILKNQIKMKNSLIDGKLDGNLRVQGFPQTPALSGKVAFAVNSLIYFKDVQFRVRDSNIVFNGEAPPNPEIYLLANTDHRGYAIEMQVLGTASKPKFKLSSTPNLTEQEIISLLTLGYTSDFNLQTQLQNQNNNQTNQTSIEVGTGLFSQNPLGKEFKDRFGFDVQFSSNFDTASSVATPKISIGKKLSDKMTLQGSALTGKDRRYDAKIRYELNRNIYGTASITSQGQEEANQNLGNQNSDVLGIDLEYRKEFK